MRIFAETRPWKVSSTCGNVLVAGGLPDFVAGNGRGYGDERYLRFCCCGSPIIIGIAGFGDITNSIQSRKSFTI